LEALQRALLAFKHLEVLEQDLILVVLLGIEVGKRLLLLELNFILQFHSYQIMSVESLRGCFLLIFVKHAPISVLLHEVMKPELLQRGFILVDFIVHILHIDSRDVYIIEDGVCVGRYHSKVREVRFIHKDTLSGTDLTS
jgi:hypothetical protein